jgi:hypothetical protein
MRPDLFVYLAGPLTARDGWTVEHNVIAALRVYQQLVTAGIPCFCPHLSAEMTEVEYETWMAHDFAVIDRCTHVLMLPRWESSPGAVREHQYAIAQGKTITTFPALMAQIAPAEAVA